MAKKQMPDIEYSQGLAIDESDNYIVFDHFMLDKEEPLKYDLNMRTYKLGTKSSLSRKEIYEDDIVNGTS